MGLKSHLLADLYYRQQCTFASWQLTTNKTTTSSCVRQCCIHRDRARLPGAVHRQPTESGRSHTWQSRGWIHAPASSTMRWSKHWRQAATRQEPATPAASCSRRRSARPGIQIQTASVTTSLWTLTTWHYQNPPAALLCTVQQSIGISIGGNVRSHMACEFL